jgi:hypothetical protein
MPGVYDAAARPSTGFYWKSPGFALDWLLSVPYSMGMKRNENERSETMSTEKYWRVERRDGETDTYPMLPGETIEEFEQSLIDSGLEYIGDYDEEE